MPVRKLRKSWWVDFRFNRDRFRLKSPENTRAGAAAYELVVRQRLARGEPVVEPAKVVDQRTFADFAREWYDVYVLANCKYSDQQTKETVQRAHLVPFFGKLLLREITSKSIENFKRQQLAKQLHPKTVNNQLGVLSKVLHCAVDWGEIDTLPIMKPLKVPPKEMRFLSEEECVQFLSNCVEPLWALMAVVALNTGMRLGELSGLRWEDCDFANGRLTVQRSIVRGRITSPKNHKMRTIPMTAGLKTTLSSIKRTKGWVFHPHEVPTDIAKKAWSALGRMCRRAGLPRFGWHVFRHTFASHLVMRGVPLYYVQKLLGHSSATMTERYSHVSSNALDDAIAVLDQRNEKFGQPVGNNATISLIPTEKAAGSKFVSSLNTNKNIRPKSDAFVEQETGFETDETRIDIT